MNESKAWYASKTLWAALVAGAAAVTGGVITQDDQTAIVGGIMAVHDRDWETKIIS